MGTTLDLWQNTGLTVDADNPINSVIISRFRGHRELQFLCLY